MIGVTISKHSDMTNEIIDDAEGIKINRDASTV